MSHISKHSYDGEVADMNIGVKKICKNNITIDEQIIFAAKSNMFLYFESIVTEKNNLKLLRGDLGYATFVATTSEDIRNFLLSDEFIIRSICVNAYSNEDIQTLEYIKNNTLILWYNAVKVKNNPPMTIEMLQYLMNESVFYEYWICIYIQKQMYEHVNYIVESLCSKPIVFSLDIVRKIINDTYFTIEYCMKICEHFVEKMTQNNVYSHIMCTRSDLTDHDIPNCMSHIDAMTYRNIMNSLVNQNNTDTFIKYFRHRVQNFSICNYLIRDVIKTGNDVLFGILINHIKIVKTEPSDDICYDLFNINRIFSCNSETAFTNPEKTYKMVLYFVEEHKMEIMLYNVINCCKIFGKSAKKLLKYTEIQHIFNFADTVDEYKIIIECLGIYPTIDNYYRNIYTGCVNNKYLPINNLMRDEFRLELTQEHIDRLPIDIVTHWWVGDFTTAITYAINTYSCDFNTQSIHDIINSDWTCWTPQIAIDNTFYSVAHILINYAGIDPSFLIEQKHNNE